MDKKAIGRDTIVTAAGVLLVCGVFGSFLIRDTKDEKRRSIRRKRPSVGIQPHGAPG